jgi:hypothetical protein
MHIYTNKQRMEETMSQQRIEETKAVIDQMTQHELETMAIYVATCITAKKRAAQMLLTEWTYEGTRDWTRRLVNHTTQRSIALIRASVDANGWTTFEARVKHVDPEPTDHSITALFPTLQEAKDWADFTLTGLGWTVGS